jgi:glycosyltransferase involved in cell wall biosynthesis
MKRIPFSIVVPAFNEQEVILRVLESISEIVQAKEILIVDDGSQDRTAQVVGDFIKSHKGVPIKLISHPYNKGYGASLKTGIRAAKSPYVMFFDADGQHHSTDVDALLKALDGYDMVVGQRINSASPLVRRPGMWLLKRLSEYLAGREIPDLNSGFRVVNKAAVERFMHILPNGFSFTTTITLAMFEGGYSVVYVPIQVKARVGRSMVSFRDAYKMLLLILRTITLFNPLKIFLPACLFLFLLGIALFVRDAINVDITLKTVMILLASLIVFFFGLISDQVANLRKDVELHSDLSLDK